MITTLIDIDNQRGWSNFEFGQDFLDLSMPWISHLTKEDNWVYGIGFGLYEFEIFSSVISSWVEVEDRLGG